MGWLEDAVRKLNLRTGGKDEKAPGADADGSGRRRSSPNRTPGNKKAPPSPLGRGRNPSGGNNNRGGKDGRVGGAKPGQVAPKGNVVPRKAAGAARPRATMERRRPDPRANTAPPRPNNNATGNTNYKKKMAPPVKAKRSNPGKTRPALTTKKPQAVPSRARTAAVGAQSALKAKVPKEFQNASPSKWQLKTFSYSGGSSYLTCGKQEKVSGKSIAKATQLFKANPGSYIALMYQSSIATWPERDHEYTLVHREGTSGYQPLGVSQNGWMTMMLHEYCRLSPFKDNVLPMKFRDKYTDNMTHKGRKLHSPSNKPIMPGRGMGIGDAPNLKIIGDVDPSDIHQGSVGDCWLLSAISSVAEFDGAIKRLFRKTKNLDKRPLDGPNMYTVTLWDISTWKEVDIEIDERLPVMGDGSGKLLASRPSVDGELWVCYLEKALAVHCGGWDKITGGQCTHAWAQMTGCKEQYNIRKNPKTRLYSCCAKYNPYEKKWAKHYNCPHDGDGTMWTVPWPKVGGGGDKELTMEALFLKICAWDKVNYIVGAGTNGTTDKHTTAGMVDNHAYSVIECHSNVAGTGIDLVKVRNPWGHSEIEDGMFDDDGPGWDQYPEIKRKLKPVIADDGIFWLTKEEFFKYFQSIYVSASNMTEFVED